MEFSQEQTGHTVVVTLAGRLDGGAAPAAEASFARVLAADPPHLAVDLSKLDYISSAGLRVLLVVARKAQQARRKVVLFALLPTVREIFSISGFDKIFSIHADRRAALASIE
jgi:anti-anti-sigma factor